MRSDRSRPGHARGRRIRTLACAALLAALLWGCGGSHDSAEVSALLATVGGSGCAANEKCVAPTRPGAPQPTIEVAAVEIVQKGLLLTATGQQRALQALVYDTSGNVQPVQVAWRSSKADVIAIDADGLAVAGTTLGSTQIVAEVAGVRSAPLVALLAELAPDTVLLDDEQIAGDPVATDPSAEASLANTYRVVLTGVPPPALGALLVGSGSKPVAGRVVAVDASGTQGITVTLALVSLPELLPALALNETIDLALAPVQFAPQLLADYDVARSGDAFSFTPRAGAGSVDQKSAGARRGGRAEKSTTWPPPMPFTECKGAVFPTDDSLPIRLGNVPPISLSVPSSLQLVHTPQHGLERFVVEARPELQFALTLEAAAAIEGKVGCTVQLFSFQIPIGGALSLLVGGVVPVGVGFELSGKLTVESLKLGGQATASATARLGVQCPGGADCTTVADVDGSGSIDWTVELPRALDARLEPSLKLFAYAEAEIGNPLLRSLRFKAFEASAGGRAKGSFALRPTQMQDTGYASSYETLFEVEAGAGASLGAALQLLLGRSQIPVAEYSASEALAGSPKGGVSADRAAWNAGETVNFRVTLDADTASFLGAYNVDRIVLVRRESALSSTEVASVGAAQGQLEFDIPITASSSGLAADYFAFAITRALPFEWFSLELGAATADTGVSVAWWSGLSQIYCFSAASVDDERDPPSDSMDAEDAREVQCSSRRGEVVATAHGTLDASPLDLPIGQALTVNPFTVSLSADLLVTAAAPSPDPERITTIASAILNGSAGAGGDLAIGSAMTVRMTRVASTALDGAGLLAPGVTLFDDANRVVPIAWEGSPELATAEVVVQPGWKLRVGVGIIIDTYEFRAFAMIPPTSGEFPEVPSRSFSGTASVTIEFVR